MELLERDAQLEAGEIGAEAAMRAGRETDVRVVRAFELDGHRVGERGRVEVRRRPDHLDLGPGREPAAVDLDVLGHPPMPERYR